MKRKIFQSMLLIGFLLLGGCDFLFEVDLSSQEVYVIMPVDGTISDENVQVLWWEVLGSALKYNIQMVEGSFASPEAMVADTNISGNMFEIQLPPGEYEWRIRAWNNFSETLYFYQYLTITDSTTNEK